MSAEPRGHAVYLDSSAIVKLVDQERESDALRRSVHRRPLVSSALARTEVMRAALRSGRPAIMRRAAEVLARIDLVRLDNQVLESAGALLPLELRSLDAIHLATAGKLGADLDALISYDDRLLHAARENGVNTASPT